MLRRLRYSISLFIILTLSNTNVLVEACYTSEISCSISDPYYRTWCCSDYSSCGTTYGSCYQNTTPTTADIIIFIVVMGSFCACCCVITFLCRRCMMQTRQSRQVVGGYVYTTPVQQSQYSYQQQPVQRSPIVTYANSNVYAHTPRPVQNFLQDIPPSYDAITKDERYNYPAPSAPPGSPHY